MVIFIKTLTKIEILLFALTKGVSLNVESSTPIKRSNNTFNLKVHLQGKMKISLYKFLINLL